MNEDEYKDLKLKLKPVHPCHNCGTNTWWWRPPSEYGCGEWLCGKCHPNPNPGIDINMPFEVEAK